MLSSSGCSNESSPSGWTRIDLIVSPDGKTAYATGGDRVSGEGDTPFIAYAHVEKWLRAYNTQTKLPWWKMDRLGWPIETVQGEPVLSFVRIVIQNARKLFSLWRKG